MWTDERINEITARATNTALSVPAATIMMRAALIEMRDEWRKSDSDWREICDNERRTIKIAQQRIAELESALDNALMESAALDTMNQECRKDNARLTAAVNQQHAELVGWRQREVVKVI